MLQVVLYLAPQNGVSTAAALSSEAAEQLFLFKRQRAGRKILKIVSFFLLSSLWTTSDPGTFLNGFSLCLLRLLHPIVIIVNT